jgi:hypothetical protein
VVNLAISIVGVDSVGWCKGVEESWIQCRNSEASNEYNW